MNKIERALIFAAEAHSGQTRKNGAPYIFHPSEAAAIAASLTDDEDVLTAVLLHDTIEDTDVTADDIRVEFGDHVAELVLGETENSYDEVSRADSWLTRKQESLEHLKMSSREVKIMWLADKLSNMRSFTNLFHSEGDRMWEHFNQKDKKVQEWYYRTIADCLSELSDSDAYREYKLRLGEIFDEVKYEENC